MVITRSRDGVDIAQMASRAASFYQGGVVELLRETHITVWACFTRR
jgi:hypothetical protein